MAERDLIRSSAVLSYALLQTTYLLSSCSLSGPAFTVIYVVAGLPLARLADTRSRPIVLLLGLVMWSAMIFLTGFVVVFWQLLTLRVFLGIGEVCDAVHLRTLANFRPVNLMGATYSYTRPVIMQSS
jgi:MFS family permease